MKFRFNIILIISIIFGSCIKELEIENSGYNKKIVVWAIINIDSNISIDVSGNRGVKPEDTLSTEIADVFLYENNILVKKLINETISGSLKTIDFKVKAANGNNYRIEISNAQLNIFSQIKTSEPLPKPDITLTKGENAQLKFTIADNATYSEAYRFDLKTYYIGTLYDSLQRKILDSNYVFSRKFDKFDEPSLNYNVITSYQNQLQNYTFPVKDVLFNGKNKTFLFYLSNPVSNNIYVSSGKTLNGQEIRNILICKKRFVLIKCLKISDEYYQFLITESKNNAIFGTSYYNPVNLYSNIIGGLGLMASQCERSDTVWVLK